MGVRAEPSDDALSSGEEEAATTIVEVRGAGGQLLERFRTTARTIAIGRSFENDLIVDDVYVSPRHLRLERIDAGWRFVDLDSTNGLGHPGSAARDGHIASGDTLTLGRTTLHVFDEHHEVEPAQPLEWTEIWLAGLGRLPIVTTLVALLVGETAVETYWSSVEALETETLLAPALSLPFVWAIVAAVWALVGRVIRHRAHFLAHLSIWIGVDLVESVTTFVAGWLGYNASSAALQDGIEMILGTLSLSAAIWASISLATGLRPRARLYAAGGTAAVLLGLNLIWTLATEDGFFSFGPDYYTPVRQPALLFATPEPASSLGESLPGLFEEARALADEDLEAEVSAPSDSTEPSD
ncbi:MAG: FHA domain-containing protein [Myxococcota bacterium]